MNILKAMPLLLAALLPATASYGETASPEVPVNPMVPVKLVCIPPPGLNGDLIEFTQNAPYHFGRLVWRYRDGAVVSASMCSSESMDGPWRNCMPFNSENPQDVLETALARKAESLENDICLGGEAARKRYSDMLGANRRSFEAK